MGFEPRTHCMQVSAPTISTTETWLAVSLNQRSLLILKSLSSTNAIGWGCHLFAVTSCQSQLLIATYANSRWFCHVLCICFCSRFTIIQCRCEKTTRLHKSDLPYLSPLGHLIYANQTCRLKCQSIARAA